MKKQSLLRQYRQCKTLTILTMAMLALVLIFGLAFAGCENEPPNKVENGEGEPLASQPSIDGGVSFNATIIEIHGTYILVEPLVNEFFPRSGERVIILGTGNLTPIDVSVGDVVTVWFDGGVMETNPPQINAIAWVLSQATTEPKSIRITDIGDATTIVRVGVWLFTELPTILSLPLPVAVGYGDNPGGGSPSLIDLTVPKDSGGLFDGPAWTGNGAYYVAAAIDRGPMVYFAGGGEAPVKIAFNQALTSLEFYRFKAWSPAE